jgi:hypothetical protein
MGTLRSEAVSQRNQATFSEPVMRLAIVAAVLVLVTSSFDIFLVFEAGGNYRFCQILTVVLVCLAMVKAVRDSIIPVLGLLPLSIWLFVQIAFVPVTDFWPKSLGYCLWLLLNLGLVFSFVQLFCYPRVLTIILRWYVYSFALVAAFGIVQFVLPVLGLGGFFVTQWWVPGVLARVNGFSYEPSYFATYLLIGFVFIGSLRRNQCRLLRPGLLRLIYWVTAIGIVLSSSRMGIVFLLGDVLLWQLGPWRSLLGDLGRLRFTPRKLRALVPSFLSLAFIGVLAAGTSAAVERNPALALMFLNGTGISDTAAHSVVQRENALEETVEVFIEHPLIGRSLGGVSWAIGEVSGERVNSFEASKQFEGMSVFAEVAAASGVIGLIPFIFFIYVTFRKPLLLARVAPVYYSVVLKALLRALLFAWMILQFNQNILRPYLWTHIAILATVYATARKSLYTSAEVSTAE